MNKNITNKLSFDFCCKCGILIHISNEEHLCYKCKTPFQEYFHEYLNGNEWIAVRYEDNHHILIGKYDSESEANYYAVMDYALHHKKEALCPNLATMIPDNLSRTDMLQLFYGIDMNTLKAIELASHGQLKEYGITWLVGIANNLLASK